MENYLVIWKQWILAAVLLKFLNIIDYLAFSLCHYNYKTAVLYRNYQYANNCRIRVINSNH